MILKVTVDNYADAVSRAAAVIKGGGVVACPTETFYCLAVRYDDPAALNRLYTIKNRPSEKSFPIIIGSMEQLYLLTQHIPPEARSLASKYWPGPLTILFDAAQGLNDSLVYKGKVAARMAGKSFAFDLSAVSGLPITATSANMSDMPPSVTAADVLSYFGEALDMIIDAGAAPGGLPSTIVDVSGSSIMVLRHGAVVLK
ncbi:MAG: threonylcarbamoyl-AMP synthase [Nitrospiraceae bacterium]|nr:threonylcarbamoyl-AMP synthase [Nitrospiraceae bacterium]